MYILFFSTICKQRFRETIDGRTNTLFERICITMIRLRDLNLRILLTARTGFSFSWRQNRNTRFSAINSTHCRRELLLQNETNFEIFSSSRHYIRSISINTCARHVNILLTRWCTMRLSPVTRYVLSNEKPVSRTFETSN